MTHICKSCFAAKVPGDHLVLRLQMVAKNVSIAQDSECHFTHPNAICPSFFIAISCISSASTLGSRPTRSVHQHIRQWARPCVCPARSTLSFSSRTSLLEVLTHGPARRNSQQSNAKQSNAFVLNAKLCRFGTSSWKTSSLQLASCKLNSGSSMPAPRRQNN